MAWDWEKLNEQQKQRKTGGIPPQITDLLQQIKNIKLPGGSIIIALLAIALLIGTSTFFTIESGSVGIIQRFGKFVRTAQPGLNFKMPFGIEKFTEVKHDRVYKKEFGLNSDNNSKTSSPSLMLTGDLNVAEVPWIVQYKIGTPRDYLFNVEDPESLLKDLSEASMRLVVGDRSINEVISKRGEIAIEAQQVLQSELNNAKAGIHIVTVEMKKTNVPQPVQASFNEVNQAVQEKERLIYKARETYNKAIPAANGEAERSIKTAEGYALDRVNRAKGDAARFESQYNEFIKAREVTKKRMYLESMMELLPKIKKKIIIDSEQKGILPFLNLETNNSGEQK